MEAGWSEGACRTVSARFQQLRPLLIRRQAHLGERIQAGASAVALSGVPPVLPIAVVVPAGTLCGRNEAAAEAINQPSSRLVERRHESSQHRPRRKTAEHGNCTCYGGASRLNCRRFKQLVGRLSGPKVTPKAPSTACWKMLAGLNSAWWSPRRRTGRVRATGSVPPQWLVGMAACHTPSVRVQRGVASRWLGFERFKILFSIVNSVTASASA